MQEVSIVTAIPSEHRLEPGKLCREHYIRLLATLPIRRFDLPQCIAADAGFNLQKSIAVLARCRRTTFPRKVRHEPEAFLQ